MFSHSDCCAGWDSGVKGSVVQNHENSHVLVTRHTFCNQLQQMITLILVDMQELGCSLMFIRLNKHWPNSTTLSKCAFLVSRRGSQLLDSSAREFTEEAEAWSMKPVQRSQDMFFFPSYLASPTLTIPITLSSHTELVIKLHVIIKKT